MAPTTFPQWAQSLRAKYLAGEASTFVLHRNVFDSLLIDGEFMDLKTFLGGRFVAETKTTVVEVSSEFGVVCVKGKVGRGGDLSTETPTRDLVGVGDLMLQLHVLETHLRKERGTAVVVPYANTLMPSENAGYISPDERNVGTLFHRWSLDRAMNGSDNITFVIVETLGSLNEGLLRNPKVVAIEIPMPDLDTRAAVVRALMSKRDAPNLATLTETQVLLYAEKMAGLRAVQIESLLRATGSDAMSEADRFKLISELLGKETAGKDNTERAKNFALITAGMTQQNIVELVDPTRRIPSADPDEDVLRLINARKRELIEKECAGLIEFVVPKHGMAAVAGCEHITGELMEIARGMRSGDTKLSPMGLLAVGPQGAGKTFVLSAFLKEAGLTGVELKNIRSKWVGSTEQNLERVLATIKAMGPIAVMIDEADRGMGGGAADGDDGTSSRYIARLKQFMSDTGNRGQVLFILMTNRPDKLDSDLKRPGRLDRKIPFFYAGTTEARATVLVSVLRRNGQAVDIPEIQHAARLCEGMAGYSNADLEAVALLALDFLARGQADQPPMTLQEALQKSKDDFMPPQERDMIDYMELLAVSETSRRSLLPEAFRQMSLEDIQTRLRAARDRALGVSRH